MQKIIKKIIIVMTDSLSAQSLVLLAPLLMAIGIIVYFSLWFEPNIIFSGIGLFVWLVITIALRRQMIAPIMWMVMWLGFGFTLANGHTAYQQKSFIESSIRFDIFNTKFLRGNVVRLTSSDAKRTAVIFKVMEVDGISTKPFLVRLTDRRNKLGDDSFASTNLPFGCIMIVKARVFPMPLKSSPKSYDIGRDWYFKGYRASGQFLAPPLIDKNCDKINHKTIAQKIKDNIIKNYPPDVRGMVLAMITGERSGISTTQMEQYRQSGLIHLISISGVHMGLVAGIAFWLLRFLLIVMRPNHSGYLFKKIAAVGAMAITIGYFLLAEYSSASLRAMMMTLVFFIGIILGRRAISLENLAIAMMLVLCYRPSDLFNPGFQLSFTAMLVLVGLYEKWWQPFLIEIEQGIFFRKKPIGNDMAIFMGDAPKIKPPRSLEKKLQIFFYALLISGTMIAIAGMPISLFHFHQASLFGIVANMAAIPMMDVFAMPLLFIKVMLLPLTHYIGDIMPLDWLIIKIFQALNWLAINIRGDEKYLIRSGGFGNPALFCYGVGLYLWITSRGMIKKISLGWLAMFLLLILFEPKPWLMVTGLESGGRMKWLARFDDIWVSPYRNSFVRRLWFEENNITDIHKLPPPPSICSYDVCQLIWPISQDKKLTMAIIGVKQDLRDIEVICKTSDWVIGKNRNILAMVKQICPAKIIKDDIISLVISPKWFGGYGWQTIDIRPRPWITVGLLPDHFDQTFIYKTNDDG